MRLLVTGDLHISEKYELLEIKSQLSAIVKAANSGCDKLILLGDIFDNGKINGTEIDVIIRVLNAIKIPIIIVAGNHDKCNGRSVISWIPKVFPNIQYSDTSIEVDLDGVKILIGHFDVKESALGASDYHLSSTLSLDNLDFPLVLSGHIHKRQILTNGKVTFLHPGSPVYLDFGERNDQKGYFIVDIKSGKFTVTPVDLHPTPMQQFVITNSDDIATTAKTRIPGSKCKVSFEYSDPHLNKLEIKKAIGKHFGRDIAVQFAFKGELPKRDIAPSEKIEDFLKFISTLDPEIQSLLKGIIE